MGINIFLVGQLKNAYLPIEVNSDSSDMQTLYNKKHDLNALSSITRTLSGIYIIFRDEFLKDDFPIDLISEFS